MATLTPAGLTIAEIVKRTAPNGTLETITEVLTEENQIMFDAVWKEANDMYGNKSVRRASEPSGSWRDLNAGIASEKSTTVTVYDTIGELAAASEIDVELIKNAPNPAQARMDEARSFINGLGKTMTSTLLYGNTAVNPERFTGISPRLNTVAATANVLDEGGSGSTCTSIYVVDWGMDTAHMIYPKGSPAGLEHKDKGEQIVYPSASSTNKMLAYVDWFIWKGGFAVKNPKSIGRIGSIQASGTSNIFDEDNLITLLNRMTKGPGRRIYVNETVMTQMEIRQNKKSNMYYTKVDGLAPGLNMTFKGVPIRQVDQILDTEAAI